MLKEINSTSCTVVTHALVNSTSRAHFSKYDDDDDDDASDVDANSNGNCNDFFLRLVVKNN